MRRWQSLLCSGLVTCLVASAVPSFVSAATNPINQSCSAAGMQNTEVCQETDQKLFGKGSIWERIINAFILAIGMVAVVFIIIGGVRYILSNGEASAVNQAKHTILYAVIGLLVAATSYMIVSFVINRLG